MFSSIKKPLNILHISDLHFGRIHQAALADLLHFALTRKAEIDLVIVTGDLTQRAKADEFLAARNFLLQLHPNIFLIPGNHDVPLYNIYQRWMNPYKKFTHYLGEWAANYYEDDAVAVYGLWTTDYHTPYSGKLFERDLTGLEHKLGQAAEHKIKIIACHHPPHLMKPADGGTGMERLLKLKPHLILWGHEHRGSVNTYGPEQSLPLMIGAGTAISSRLKSEPNSFNLISITDQLTVETFRFNANSEKFYSFARRDAAAAPLLAK